MAVDTKFQAAFGPANVEFWGKVAELEKAGVHNALNVARERMPELYERMEVERSARRSESHSTQEQKIEAVMGSYQRGTIPDRYSRTPSHGHGPFRREFFQRVDDYVAEGMDRHKATARVVRENPDLHQDMLREVNG